jgi:hypothetical protein
MRRREVMFGVAASTRMNRGRRDIATTARSLNEADHTVFATSGWVLRMKNASSSVRIMAQARL